MQVSDQVLDVFRGAVIQYVELGIVREDGGHLCLHHDGIVVVSWRSPTQLMDDVLKHLLI